MSGAAVAGKEGQGAAITFVQHVVDVPDGGMKSAVGQQIKSPHESRS
jgi:hypothetical protein